MKLRYSEFARRIDVDQFEEAIGFDPIEHARGFDIGHCPDPWGLHKNGDSTGKFGIHTENRAFNCFVCGGGTLLSLSMAIKDMDEEQAIDWLYEFTTPEDQTDDDFIDEIERILAVAKAERPVDPYFNEHVLDKWNPRGSKEFADWAQERGISLNVADQYRLRYDFKHLRRSKSKGEYTGPAIILPHFWNQKLVGWQVRWLDDNRPKWVPKYTNTHDFPRDRTLFNYEQVYLSPDPIVVVESVSTVLFLTSIGVPAVATFGSNVSDEQVRLLRKCQQGLILARDDDPAGEKWVRDDRPDHEPLAEKLVRYVPVRVAITVGDGDSGKRPGETGGDLGCLVGREGLLRDILAMSKHYYNLPSGH